MSFIKAAIIFALLGVSQANPAPVILQTDDVLVVRDDGSPAVMKYWEYDIQEAKAEVARRKTGIPRFRAPAGKKLTDRCEESTEVQVLSDTHFTNWDVTMSPVIENTGAGASVSVTQGYSIQNSITVGESVQVSVEDFLSSTYSIQVSESWTTTNSQTYMFSVPAGQWGVVVSNPYTRRLSGNVVSGCTDSPTTEEFSSDSYTSQSYGDLSWVTGPIRICNSSTYPVPYCVGTGTHT